MLNFYVSPNGDDKAKGALEAPLKTLEEAVKRVSAASEADWDGQASIVLRGGTYAAPSGGLRVSLRAPVRVTAYPNETPVIDGGEALSGVAEGELNGKRVWTCDIPDVKRGKWFFKTLFAGGKRRPRASLPKDGFYWMKDVPDIKLGAQLFEGSNRFIAASGDVKLFRNLNDAEIHAFHYWTDEHMPIRSFDPATCEVVCTHTSIFALQDDSQPRFAKYRVEHVFEGLEEPGEWYLDRAQGRLYYLPEAEETLENTALVAPRTDTLLTLDGCQDVQISGLAFRHADWNIVQGIAESFKNLEGQQTLYASSPQAASHLPGAINLLDCSRCAIEECEISRVGYYAVDARRSHSLRVCGCTMFDLGAGGVKINGSTPDQKREARAHHIRVEDNDIGFGGRVFLSGIGVCAMHASHVTVAHNHIHDLYYSGVSMGWVWGYAESASYANTIEYNHIHMLGHGILSDMGGVYTLGVQPETVIRHNLIHDIEKSNYGGWAIYPDEGSSHIVIENNVSYNTSSSSFHQHYGHENIVRNNIWAFGREGQIAYSRDEGHTGFTFEHNIVLTKGQPIHVGGYSNKILQGNIKTDLNVYWDVDGGEIVHADQFNKPETRVSFEQAKEIGYDLHSVVADPLCADPEHGDFTLSPDSPAFALGFVPIDLSEVGPRKAR